MFGEHGIDVAADLNPRGGQQDEVIADPFDVRHQMRGQDDGQPARRDGVGERAEEMPPGERVQGRERFVEQQDLRPLGQRECEGHLSALAARQRPTAASSGMFSPRSRSRTDPPSHRGFMRTPTRMWSAAVGRQ